MTTLYQDIRAALQTRAVATTGFPGSSNIAYDDQPFTPVVGTTWARLTLIPNGERPFDVPAELSVHRGMFQVSLYGKSGVGTGALESLADAVRDQFKPKLNLFQGSVRVQVERVERTRALLEPGSTWLQIPVTVYWRCFVAN